MRDVSPDRSRYGRELGDVQGDACKAGVKGDSLICVMEHALKEARPTSKLDPDTSSAALHEHLRGHRFLMRLPIADRGRSRLALR